MRICLHTFFEITNPYIGGTQTLLIKLAKELKILGHDAFIVCSSLQPKFIIEGVEIYGVIPHKYKRLLIESYNGIASSQFLKEAIFNNQSLEYAFKELSYYSHEQYTQFKADVYHLNSFVAAAFANVERYTFVVSNHENQYEFDGFWGDNAYAKFSDMVRNKMTKLHMITSIFTASKFYANDFSKTFGLNVKFIHLGVALNDMLYSKHIHINNDTSFNRSDNTIVVLIPSRFNAKQKGQDIALQACENILNKYNIEVVFSGVKQSLADELRRFRNKYNYMQISNHTHFIAAPDMYEIYDSVHVVLSPERYCTYGLSISESLAIGIPTVLSNIPTYKEIALGYEHAFFFKKDNLNDLMYAICRAIESSKNNNFRYNKASIQFRIDNDIRKTAVAFSNVYASLF